MVGKYTGGLFVRLATPNQWSSPPGSPVEAWVRWFRCRWLWVERMVFWLNYDPQAWLIAIPVVCLFMLWQVFWHLRWFLLVAGCMWWGLSLRGGAA